MLQTHLGHVANAFGSCGLVRSLPVFFCLLKQKMSLHKKTRDTIDALFAAGQQPVKLKTSEGIGILNGRRPIVLVTAAGVKTNAGIYYEQKSETNLPDGGFLQQDARRDGNVETILLRDGRRGITRRFDASGFKFTPLGTAYYRTMRRTIS